ncbi:hypothetical protein DMP15_29020 [Pseudonocardia sp. UM4_GMWB1]
MGAGEVHAGRSAAQPVEDAEELQPAHDGTRRAAPRVDVDRHRLCPDPHALVVDDDRGGDQLPHPCLRQVQDHGGDDEEGVAAAVEPVGPARVAQAAIISPGSGTPARAARGRGSAAGPVSGRGSRYPVWR